MMLLVGWQVDLEIDRVDRSSRSIFSRVESIDRVDSSRVDRSSRSSEREVESVDNIDSKSTFGSGICHQKRNQQTMNVPILCFTGKTVRSAVLHPWHVLI